MVSTNISDKLKTNYEQFYNAVEAKTGKICTKFAEISTTTLDKIRSTIAELLKEGLFSWGDRKIDVLTASIPNPPLASGVNKALKALPFLIGLNLLPNKVVLPFFACYAIVDYVSGKPLFGSKIHHHLFIAVSGYFGAETLSHTFKWINTTDIVSLARAVKSAVTTAVAIGIALRE